MEPPPAREQRPDRRPSAGRAPAGPAGRGPGRNASGGPQPCRPPSAEPARLRELTAGFTQAFLEVEAGRRPRRQLDSLLCPLLAARLADVWVRTGALGKVVRVRGALVAPDRYEAVVVVRRGRRCGALAVVLARHGHAWRVVDAARPEDGVLPQPPAWCPWSGEPEPEPDEDPTEHEAAGQRGASLRRCADGRGQPDPAGAGSSPCRGLG